MEEIGHLASGGIPPIDEVFALPPYENLACHVDLLALLVADGARCFVFIVKHNCDAGLVYAGLPLLVNELGQIPSANLAQIGDAENEADGVQNIRFSRSIEAGDCIEVGIKSVDYIENRTQEF